MPPHTQFLLSSTEAEGDERTRQEPRGHGRAGGPWYTSSCLVAELTRLRHLHPPGVQSPLTEQPTHGQGCSKRCCLPCSRPILQPCPGVGHRGICLRENKAFPAQRAANHRTRRQGAEEVMHNHAAGRTLGQLPAAETCGCPWVNPNQAPGRREPRGAAEVPPSHR